MLSHLMSFPIVIFECLNQLGFYWYIQTYLLEWTVVHTLVESFLFCKFCPCPCLVLWIPIKVCKDGKSWTGKSAKESSPYLASLFTHATGDHIAENDMQWNKVLEHDKLLKSFWYSQLSARKKGEKRNPIEISDISHMLYLVVDWSSATNIWCYMDCRK